MSEPFAGQAIVITGASEGIGRALALALARQRARLTLAARNLARLEELAVQCRAFGAVAQAVVTDITNESACCDLIERSVETYGALDVLVNNAGATMWSRFEDLQSLDLIEPLLRVNLLGSIYCTRHALPHLRAARGRILVVASLAGFTGVPERTVYAASKHAQVGFFDSLRIELAGSGISVTIAAPDFVVTQIHRRAIGADGRALGETPMRESRIMTAEACAQAMLHALARRRRLWIGSARGRFGRWAKLLAPGLVDRIAARAIRSRA